MAEEEKPSRSSGQEAGALESGDEAAGQNEFERLLDASFQAVSFEKGQSVEGVIVALDGDGAFIDIGGKGEATIDLAELENEDGQVDVVVGDRVRAVVVSTRGGLKLSRKLARGAAAQAQLEAAFQSRLPVEGRVEAVNKGGYEVRMAGRRAFCPLSQMDTARTVDPAEHIGQVYAFRIREFKDDGRNMVISRRVILEEEEREKADEMMRTLVPGAVLRGRVVSVQDYGAFIDLGAGIQGLLHVSEMSWARVSRSAEVVQPGEEITVHVLKVDSETRKISLSLKQLQEDPWSRVPATYAIGQLADGRVTRVAEFGAFVELEPGIEALAHSSTYRPVKGGWKNAVQVGALSRYRIESIDMERRRIGVAMHDAPRDEAAAPDSRTDGHGDEKDSGVKAETKRSSSEPGSGGFGSFADQLRSAIKPGKNKD